MPAIWKRDYLSGVDTAWLRMEDPTNLMMITGIFLFDGLVDPARLTRLLERRLLKFDRFRQRVVQPRLGLPYWVDDEHFDIRSHVHRVALPAPGDQAALEAYVSQMMSAPLDYSRPLWQAHLIENYGAGSALLMRLHHCIADGIALMFVLLDLTDTVPGADEEVEAAETTPGRRRPGNPVARFLQQTSGLVRGASTAADRSRRMTEKVLRDGLDKAMHPSEAFDLVKQGSGLAAASAISLARLTLRPPDPATLFKGPLSVQKKAAWSAPLSLDEVKALGRVTGGTVNDVLLTAMTGALRRYLLGRGEPVDGLSFRAAVPVNLRPLDRMGDLGNKFGLVFLSLPVGLADPLERLHQLKRNMDQLKDTPEAVVAFGVLGAMGMTPAEVQNIGVNIFGAKLTAVMTNVPGPRQPLYFAGRAIDGIMFWVPQSGRVGLGISILSYAGTVRLGVATDAALVPDPKSIVEHFHDELADMMQLVAWAEAEESQSAAAA